MPVKWQKIEIGLMEKPPALLNADDVCYFAREYKSHGGYAASEANQLISNFKKKPSTRGTYQWPHKQRAAAQFANELRNILPPNSVIAFVPTSKIPTDPDYDPRFDMVRDYLLRIRADIRVESPVSRTKSCDAVHSGGTRKRAAVRESLEWEGFKEEPETVMIIDDVITAGTHFRVIKDLIGQNSNATVIGVFWARTVWPDEEAA
jgi:hypothetical protein